MDNYHYFCKFFGVDQNVIEQYGKLMGNFKTMFPVYVFNNDGLQHAITEARGGYETYAHGQARQDVQKFSDDDPHRTASLFDDCPDAHEEDLNFRDSEVIAMIELLEYQQNQYISCSTKKDAATDLLSNVSHDNGDPGSNSRRPSQKQRTYQEPLETETSHVALNTLKKGALSLQYEDTDANSGGNEKDKVFVRHLLDIKNTRFLYTRNVFELIEHHLVRGFDYTKYRKTDYIDVGRQKAKKRNFLDGYKESENNYTTKTPQGGHSGINQPQPEIKEAYMAMRMINPQINMQDGPAKAQALITSVGSV